MISDFPLTVIFKNFKRNRMVNLSATSVKHFLPNAKIACLTLFKESMDEYKEQDPLLSFIEQWTEPTKYVSGKDVHDHPVNGQCSGYGHPLNGAFFCEGYNLIYERVKDTNDKVLMLAEDHYFTSGMTLWEVIDSDWDACWAGWHGDDDTYANASLLGVRPQAVAGYFPLLENSGGCPVEFHLGQNFIQKLRVAGFKTHLLSTRNGIDYGGDGECVNSSDLIRAHMLEAGII